MRGVAVGVPATLLLPDAVTNDSAGPARPSGAAGLAGDPSQLAGQGDSRWDRWKILAGAASAVLILIVGALAFTTTTRLIAAGDRVTGVRETLAHLRQTVAILREAETAQRGYLLTGDSLYLRPYEGAEEAIATELDELRGRFADDSTQLRRLAMLESLTADKFAELARTIRLRREEGFTASSRAVRTDAGMAIMQGVRAVAAEMEAEENERLAARQREERESASTALRIIVVGSLLAFALVAAAVWVLFRALIDVREAAERQRVLGAQQLGVAAAATAIADARSLEDLLERVTVRIREIIGAHQAVTSTTTDMNWSRAVNAISLSTKYERWRDYSPIPDSAGIYSTVARTNSPIRLTQRELEEHPAFRRFAAGGAAHPPMRGWLAVPLIGLDGRNIGVIHLSDKYDGEFTEQDEAIAVQLAQLVAVAIENARLFAEAQDARRRAEQSLAIAEQANAAKSEFLSTMSHEIRTPINAIVGYAELLEMGLSGPISDEQRTQLGRVRESGRHLLTLVNEVLDLSKIEAGQMVVRSEESDAFASVEGALALVRPQAASRGIIVSESMQRDRPARYVGDPHRVRQIVVNLLSNAVKFTNRGGRVTLGIGTAAGEALPPQCDLDPECQWTTIVVQDTGIGIPPAEQEAIFEPFTQGESGLTRTKGGTGLGLAISRRLARLMGGDLTVESEPGVGSRFTLWLPEATHVASGLRNEAADAKESAEDRR